MNLDLKKTPNYTNSRWIDKRMEDTFKFVQGFDLYDYNKKVLAIGAANYFDQQIRLDAKFTRGDLDYIWEPIIWDKYDFVFMFEVIEHLMNPLKFLQDLKKFIADDAIVFISYPHRAYTKLWIDVHFHEYDSKRFNHLLESAGYEVVKYKQVTMTGFRGMGSHTIPNAIKKPKSIFNKLLSITPLGSVKKQYYAIRVKK